MYLIAAGRRFGKNAWMLEKCLEILSTNKKVYVAAKRDFIDKIVGELSKQGKKLDVTLLVYDEVFEEYEMQVVG